MSLLFFYGDMESYYAYFKTCDLGSLGTYFPGMDSWSGRNLCR